jgi:hypothetical protein
MMTRAEVLDTAKGYITRDRQATHGKAESNFGAIAGLWNAYLKARGLLIEGEGLDTIDVGQLMVLFKVARAAGNKTHMDNYIDMVGYAAISGELAAEFKHYVDGLGSEVTDPVSSTSPVGDHDYDPDDDDAIMGSGETIARLSKIVAWLSFNDGYHVIGFYDGERGLHATYIRTPGQTGPRWLERQLESFEVRRFQYMTNRNWDSADRRRLFGFYTGRYDQFGGVHTVGGVPEGMVRNGE